MAINTLEKNSENFIEAKLLKAQSLTKEALHEISQQITAGMTEKEALYITDSTFKLYGFEKYWHAPKIRFGPNTVKTFSETSEPGVILQENDIYFLDFGPVFLGHEADFGETFVVGNNPELLKLKTTANNLFDQLRKSWKEKKISGIDLYKMAVEQTEKLGYKFNLDGGSGHRIGDFPHHVHFRGDLAEVDFVPYQNRWILEVQIYDAKLNRGAFVEDIL